MPVSNTFSGSKPFLRLNSIISHKVNKAEPMPMNQNTLLSTCTSNSNTAANTPRAVPELMPSNSGLAIGFCVSRCRNTPAVASMMPQAAAVKRRG